MEESSARSHRKLRRFVVGQEVTLYRPTPSKRLSSGLGPAIYPDPDPLEAGEGPRACARLVWAPIFEAYTPAHVGPYRCAPTEAGSPDSTDTGISDATEAVKRLDQTLRDDDTGAASCNRRLMHVSRSILQTAAGAIRTMRSLVARLMLRDISAHIVVIFCRPRCCSSVFAPCRSRLHTPVHCPTDLNLADLFTKILSPPRFKQLRDRCLHAVR